MAISDSQIQDLINKVNIIQFTVSANLNTRVSDILANTINGNNSLQNRLTQVMTQATSLTQYNINTIGSYINGAVNQIYTNTNNSTAQISKNIQDKINSINQDIQLKQAAIEHDIELKLNSINADIKDKITSIVNPILVEIDKNTNTITKNINNSIDGLNVSVKTTATQTQNLLNETALRINSAIQTLSATTSSMNNNQTPVTPSYSNIFGASEPPWLTSILEKFYTQQSTPKNTPADTFWTALIRIISGDATADVFNKVDTLNITENILEQVTKLGAIEENIVRGKYKTVDDLSNDLKRIGVNSPILGAVLQLPFIIANIGEVFKTLFLPTIVKLEQLLIASYSLKQLNENDLLTAFIRNNMSSEDVHKNLDNLGHSSDDSNLLMKNILPKYTIQEVFRLGYLGKMNGDDVKKYMRTLGWDEQDTITHGYLNQPRPGIQDLIAFAVKEVYSPEIYQKFGQYNEFPKQFAEEAKLLGLDDKYAQEFWAAHWALPGAQQGFDLFHRGLITHEDLVALLKALDVMPFWREKLIGLSYNIVARVDTRRLYAYNIWDEKKVYENYLHEGYSPSDAKDLTNFTIQYDNEQDNKHKTALQKKAHDIYIKSYNYGIIDQNTAQTKIVALGYKEKDVALELSLEKYEQYVDLHKPKLENNVQKITALSLDGYRKKAISRQDLLVNLTSNGYSLSDANAEADFMDKEADIAFKESVVKEIQKLYFESLLDDNATLTKLMQLGFANSEALHIISQLQILKGLDDKKPTPAQFKNMFEDGIISKEDYALELASMGYNIKFIPNIIALSAGKGV